ncbi:uncharacterized protein LOC113660559 [Tachysurus fulvidraco]|uniref:uncharacterized protein LOC113660559 n=1 Tax=Tachysurus fulvidraco TaxID=1234273 RepID=UPI000F4E61C1|nr:uncharacterized protein LOC113660559 [Tachysurus fulvidraco]
MSEQAAQENLRGHHAVSLNDVSLSQRDVCRHLELTDSPLFVGQPILLFGCWEEETPEKVVSSCLKFLKHKHCLDRLFTYDSSFQPVPGFRWEAWIHCGKRSVKTAVRVTATISAGPLYGVSPKGVPNFSKFLTKTRSPTLKGMMQCLPFRRPPRQPARHHYSCAHLDPDPAGIAYHFYNASKRPPLRLLFFVPMAGSGSRPVCLSLVAAS